MKVKALAPLRIRRSNGEIRLAAGDVVDLPESDAMKLAEKVPGKVQFVEDEAVVIEPAQRPDGAPLRPVFWETSDGRILGPATPEFFLQSGDEFWISMTFEGQIRFVRSDRLRSKKAFETQRKPQVIEPVRGLR